MNSVPPEAVNCPKCATPGTGKFCAECGARLSPRECTSCKAQLSEKAKFCPKCGVSAPPSEIRDSSIDTAASASAANLSSSNATAGKPAPLPQASGLAASLPWAVAGIAFLALFAMLAGRSFNKDRGSKLDAPMTALPNPALDGPFAGMSQEQIDAMGKTGAGMGEVVRAPDISGMSPADLAERLYNRIMLLSSMNKTDSVQFFAPMAIQAYQMAQDAQGGKLDLCQRYDIGRIAEVSGAIPLAKLQADTILQNNPDHLLGLILAGRVARQTGNSPSQKEYAERFAKVKEKELAAKRVEYEKHQTDIAAGPPPVSSN